METPPLDSVIDKLMQMGWLVGRAEVDSKTVPGNKLNAIVFTSLGKEKLTSLSPALLVAEIEHSQGHITDAEKNVLSGFPMLARQQGGSNPRFQR